MASKKELIDKIIASQGATAAAPASSVPEKERLINQILSSQQPAQAQAEAAPTGQAPVVDEGLAAAPVAVDIAGALPGGQLLSPLVQLALQTPQGQQIAQQIPGPTRGDVLRGVNTVGTEVDRFTGAPVRRLAGRALGVETQPGQIAPTGRELAGGLGLGEESALADIAQTVAPTLVSGQEGRRLIELGEQALTQAVPEIQQFIPSRQTVAGLALEGTLDISNVIPGIGLTGKALKKTSTAVPLLQNAKRVILGDGDRIRRAVSATGEIFTGVGRKLTNTYIEKTEKINQLINRIGGDVPAGIQDEVDALRRDVSSSIQQTRAGLNQEITKALKAAPEERTIDISGVKGALDDAAEELIDGTLEPEMARDLAVIIERVATKSGKLPKNASTFERFSALVQGREAFKVNLSELQSIKNFLQKRARRAFQKDGQIFQNAKETQVAAKRGLKAVNRIMNQLAPQEILDANKQLAKLHVVEDRMNAGLLKQGAPTGVITRVGRGTNAPGQALFRRIEELTGAKAVERAEEIAAAEQFAAPSLTPLSSGTTSTTRTILSSAIGGILGRILEVPGGTSAGVILGNILSSPASLKVAVNTGRFPRDLFRTLTGGNKITIDTAQRAFNTLATPRGVRIVEQYARRNNISLPPAATRDEQTNDRPR